MTFRPTLQAKNHTLLAAGLLALFVALLYAALLFTNRVLASGDILLYFSPYRAYVSEALRQGRIPFWNPYIFMGAPLLANPQAAVFYPLHLPLLWLSVAKQLYWSAALHTWLLGLGGYLLLRCMGGGWLAGITAGLALAGSGFFGGMIGHLNQMNAATWLPWLLLFITPTVEVVPGWRRLWWSTAGFAVVVTLLLLAGHTQTAYINLFGVGMWALALAVRTLWLRRQEPTLAHEAWFLPLAIYALGVAIGGLVAAPQLLPTLELSQLGIRSGGLSFVEATSFSLKPLSLAWTLLPTYGLLSYQALFDTAAWSEFIAWIGIVGLGLAGFGAWQGRGLARWLGLGFAILGLALALGRWNPAYWVLHQFVPGFDLFRTPARWMMLYTLGVAVLAGLGAQALVALARARTGPHARTVRFVQIALPLLLAVELLLAGRALPQANPTTPEALYGLRTAPAHLMTDPERRAAAAAGNDVALGGRFLGMSTITFDPGDMADSARLYRDPANPQLTQGEFDELIIAQKVQELLVPNLSLFWRIPAVDGYDGGTLPLRRYNALVALLAPDASLAPDGRLREQIVNVPPAALLQQLGVRYLITDKVRDLWFDGIFYDRQIGMTLSGDAPQAALSAPAPFEATDLDLIAVMEGTPEALASLRQTTVPVASVRFDEGVPQAPYLLEAGSTQGARLADGALDTPVAASSGAVVAYRDVEGGRQEYRVRIPFDAPSVPTTITIALDSRASALGLSLRVQAATLFDSRTGMFAPLLPSDRGAFALVHSGDVKIYENLQASSRAWLAYSTTRIAGDEADPGDDADPDADNAAAEAQALALLIAQNPRLPGAVVGAAGPQLDAPASYDASGDRVDLVSYQPERIEIHTRSAADALLVLADAHYPGWTAAVDGVPAPIYTTNVLFRGVEIPAGEHTIVFTFAPTNWNAALVLAGVGMLLLLALVIAGFAARDRSQAQGRALATVAGAP